MTAVNLTQPEQVATLILTAAVTCYDPGTQPWRILHDAADEIREAIATPHPEPTPIERRLVSRWETPDAP